MVVEPILFNQFIEFVGEDGACDAPVMDNRRIDMHGIGCYQMDRDVQQSRSRLEFLDALRGLAAVYVVVFHMQAMPELHLPVPSALAGIVGFGGSGVALFFLMSAFSLCYTMPRHQASEAGVASFYLHRILRIAPLLFFWLVLMVAKDALRTPHRYSLAEVAGNLTFIYSLVPTWQPGIVTASWTVGVEMLFYAVFPAIFAMVRSGRSAAAALLLSSVAWWLCRQFGGDALAHLTGPMGVIFQLPVFAAGMLCFALWRSEALANGTAQGRLVGITLTAVGCAGVFALAKGWLGPMTFAQNWYIVAACYGLVLLGLSQVPLNLFINRCTRHLGTLSYSIYLAHPMVISRLHGLYAWAYGLSSSSGLRIWLGFGISLTATIAAVLTVAHFTYRYIERPGVRLGNRLVAHIAATRRRFSEVH